MLKKIALGLALTLLNLSNMAYAEGRAKIGLKPDVASTYITSNDNPWLTESWGTSSHNFNLSVESLTKNSPIYLAHLVLSIPHDAANSGWSFTLNGTTFHYSDFSDAGLHPYLSPHGVFSKKDGALWFDYNLGTINAGQTLSVAFTSTGLPHGMLLHFDAYGSSLANKQNGHYFNAFSHDLTVTPEPVSAALFLLGGLALSSRKLFAKKSLRKGTQK